MDISIGTVCSANSARADGDECKMADSILKELRYHSLRLFQSIKMENHRASKTKERENKSS